MAGIVCASGSLGSCALLSRRDRFCRMFAKITIQRAKEMCTFPLLIHSRLLREQLVIRESLPTNPTMCITGVRLNKFTINLAID